MADIASVTVESETPAPSSLLAGTWYNELGSTLTIQVDGTGGLRGHYTSGAGSVAGNTYPLVGTYDPNAQGHETVVGFVVDWTEIHAVTVWSGQYHHADETIRATWLMATETAAGDEWRSTFVGHDVFWRGRVPATGSLASRP